MECKITTVLRSIVALLVVLSNTHAASTTNGKLLKLYPITKQQYREILALTKQQPAVSESDVIESHRSLADWSNTLHSSWNTIFNGTGEVPNKTSGKQGVRGYPICVIKTQDLVRRKRGARQYHYNADYAGLAPNVVYPGPSYYGRPPYRGRPHYRPQYYQPYEEESIDDEINNDGDEPESNDADPEDVPNGDDNNNVPEKDSNAPIINCVVVIRRKNQIINRPPTPDMGDTEDTSDVDGTSPPSYGYPQYPHYPYPPHKQPPSYAYPPPIPPHGHYPYPYPPHPHPYPVPHPQPYGSSAPYGQPSSRSNEYPVMDPVTAVQYQQMIAEYYKHLHALYMADASTGMARTEYQPEYVDDEMNETSIEDDGKENIETQSNDKENDFKESV